MGLRISWFWWQYGALSGNGRVRIVVAAKKIAKRRIFTTKKQQGHDHETDDDDSQGDYSQGVESLFAIWLNPGLGRSICWGLGQLDLEG